MLMRVLNQSNSIMPCLTTSIWDVNKRFLSVLLIFITKYLVNPNNLLTHTHTHTHTFLLASNHTFLNFAYARAKRAVSLINKGLP